MWADPDVPDRQQYTETLVRLPHGFLCYRPPEYAPEPATRSAPSITFGSFNVLSKVGAPVVNTWARILCAVPESRLLLKAKSLADDAIRARLRDAFANLGISDDRVEMQGWLPDAADHLGLYHRLDIALDPFPYNGTTTTCEALWMGVPVITLAGRLHAGRVGVSLLTRVGLPELIAGNEDDYIQRAVELANAPDRLQTLRATLRQRLRASSLCDGPGFARDVEAAYREMWRRWCRNKS
jgi:predicted O-linked N-acetylglucosamine transferase (SPINDLY family)